MLIMGCYSQKKGTSLLNLITAFSVLQCFQNTASSFTAYVTDLKIVAIAGEQYVATCEVTGNLDINPQFIIFTTNGEPEQTPANKCEIAKGEPQENFGIQYRYVYYICDAAEEDDGKTIGCTTTTATEMTEDVMEITYAISAPIEITSKDCRSQSVTPPNPQRLTTSESLPMSTATTTEAGLQTLLRSTKITTDVLPPCEQPRVETNSDTGTHRQRRYDSAAFEGSPSPNGDHGNTTVIVSLSVTTAVLALFLLIGVICFLKQRQNRSHSDVERHTMEQLPANDHQ